MKFSTMVIAVFFSFGIGFCAVGQEKGAQNPTSPEKLKKRAVVEGKIACIGCTISEQDPDANPQCTLHSKHAQGLVTGDGAVFSFLDNEKGHHLVSDPKWKGKEMKVLGWKFPKAQFIEISKFQMKDGDKWVDYDFCKNCGFEPGDNKDTDVCEDCTEK